MNNRVSILDSILYSCEDREWSIKLLLNGTVTNSNSIRNSRRRTGQWMCLHSTFFLFINFFSLRKQPKLARNLSMPPLVSPRNDVWGTSAEIPYWWRVTTQIWVRLLIGRAMRKICLNQSEALSRPRQWHVIKMEFLRSFLRRHFAGKPKMASRNDGCFLRLMFVNVC